VNVVPKDLSCARYRVVFEAREPLDLPGYLGSTLRGAFGDAFRAVACPGRIDEPCPIPLQCPYHLIFETSPAPGSDALRTHDEIPRPFVIAPANSDQGHSDGQARRLFRPGDEVSFELVLIGRAQEFFPYFVVALREVNRIGRGRQAVELRRIDALSAGADQSRAVYAASENLVRGSAESISIEAYADDASDGTFTIEFLTQTRLKHEGRLYGGPIFRFCYAGSSDGFRRCRDSIVAHRSTWSFERSSIKPCQSVCFKTTQGGQDGSAIRAARAGGWNGRESWAAPHTRGTWLRSGSSSHSGNSCTSATAQLSGWESI
jgi:hypothetical protein